MVYDFAMCVETNPLNVINDQFTETVIHKLFHDRTDVGLEPMPESNQLRKHFFKCMLATAGGEKRHWERGPGESIRELIPEERAKLRERLAADIKPLRFENHLEHAQSIENHWLRVFQRNRTEYLHIQYCHTRTQEGRAKPQTDRVQRTNAKDQAIMVEETKLPQTSLRSSDARCKMGCNSRGALVPAARHGVTHRWTHGLRYPRGHPHHADERVAGSQSRRRLGLHYI